MSSPLRKGTPKLKQAMERLGWKQQVPAKQQGKSIRFYQKGTSDKWIIVEKQNNGEYQIVPYLGARVDKTQSHYDDEMDPETVNSEELPF